MSRDFQPLPVKWSLIAQVGGLVTAIALMFGAQALEAWIAPTRSARLSPQTSVNPTQVSQFDRESNSPSALKIDLKADPAMTSTGQLSAQEQAMAKSAWQYFAANWNGTTGLVNGLDRLPVTSIDDVSSGLAALVSVRELALIDDQEFDTKLRRLFQTLKTLPLYHDELPARLYQTTTLKPVAIHPRTGQAETGWSAISIGRLARWLKIVGSRYPQYQPDTLAIWQQWQVNSLVQEGQLMGAIVQSGQEQIYQQGRLGYESYAAYGLQLWGLPVQAALKPETSMMVTSVYGQPIPHDRRPNQFDNDASVTSEPYIMDGIETGFRALPRSFAEAVLRSQMARFQTTQQLTAVATEASDRAPFILHNTVIANQRPWATYSGSQRYDDFRQLSTKAAIGWFVLYPNDYTQRLVQVVQSDLGSDRGWKNGFYETLRQPNQTLSADTNGLILASLLYRKVNQPLMDWAGVPAPIKNTTP
jgi:Protein of unknown function (DUF3131)